MYLVYILECRDGSFYTGITTDLARRFAAHAAGKGGSYTRSHGAKRMVYHEKRRTRGLALRREMEIKSWPRKKKLELARGRG